MQVIIRNALCAALCGLTLSAGAAGVTGDYEQIAEFQPVVASASKFGISVAMSAAEAFVATPTTDVSGFVSLFKPDKTGNWTLADFENDTQPVTDFGSYLACNPIAVDGDVTAVGIPSADDGTTVGQGAVITYTRDNITSTWREEVISNPGMGASDSFGCSLGLSKGKLLVGAPGAESTGVGYVFHHESTGWVLDSKLKPVAAADKDAVGRSAAFDGSLAVLGAPHAQSGRGAAYVFSQGGRGWTQTKMLQASDGAVTDSFGATVAISNTGIAVGAPSRDSARGLVYVFSGTAWSTQQEVQSPLASKSGDFGAALSMDGGLLAVGEPGNDAAYVFGKSDAGWIRAGAFGGVRSSRFGASVSVSESFLLVGAMNEGNGRAYLFESDKIFADGFQ
jgi:FG-GAP repeat